jgi:hypothetical protein
MNRFRSAALAVVLFSACGGATTAVAAGAQPKCDLLAGADGISSRSDVRFVIFGEIHGTVEIPKVFLSAVCEVSARRPVTVGLELDEGLQPALDTYLSGDGSEAAKKLLLKHSFWRPARADGRTSRAMLELIERLRQFRAAGRPIQVVAFRTWRGRSMSQGYSELKIAASWVRAAELNEAALVMVLTGRVHARKASFPGDAMIPAAAHLPKGDIISLAPSIPGGSYWGCRSRGVWETNRQGCPGSRTGLG